MATQLVCAVVPCTLTITSSLPLSLSGLMLGWTGACMAHRLHLGSTSWVCLPELAGWVRTGHVVLHGVGAMCWLEGVSWCAQKLIIFCFWVLCYHTCAPSCHWLSLRQHNPTRCASAHAGFCSWLVEGELTVAVARGLLNHRACVSKCLMIELPHCQHTWCGAPYMWPPFL